MASYQVMCSVTRPLEPTSVCHISDFQDKKTKHLGTVFQDWGLTLDPVTSKGDEFMLCALVSKTNASFIGSVNSFESQVRLPFFWCDLCPYETENKASLLQHMVQQHCFVCRHCSFVALSRCAVAQHSLKQHPEFAQQFRDQRLKRCQLERQKFQQYFNPEFSLQPMPRKRSAESEPDPEEASDTEPCKKSRRESNDDGSQETETQHSESILRRRESLDEILRHQGQHQSPASGDGSATPAPESSPTPDAEVCLTNPELGENVVSSSGMEIEADATKGDAPAVGDSNNGSLQQAPKENATLESSQNEATVKAEPCESVPSGLQRPSAITVKLEQSIDDEEFACALGKTSTDFAEAGNTQECREDESSAHALHPDADDSAHGHSVQDNQRHADTLAEELRSPSSEYSSSISASGMPPRETNPIAKSVHTISHSPQNPPSVTVKQEKSDCVEEFSHALGKSSKFTDVVDELECRGAESSGSLSQTAANIPLKQEPDVFDEEESGTHSPSISSRSVVSPPLSNIRVENLQRQVEESFGIHLPVSDCPATGPHPVHMYSASSKREELVDNFLLDSPHSQLKATGSDPHVFSEGLVEGHMGTSMLRQLLTQPSQRPRGVLSVSRSSSLENGDDSLPEAAQEESETISSNRHEGTSKSQEQSIDNFLLTPEGTDNKDDLEELKITFSEKHSAAHCNCAPEEVLWLKSEKKDDPCIPVTSVDSQPDPNCSTACSSHQHPAAAISAMMPAEKLKTYANMSLRDLLTMRTEISQTPVQTKEKRSASITDGEVVWECGFCYFADTDKAVVLAHRRQHHAQHMEQAGLGGAEEKNSARSSEEEDEQWSDTRLSQDGETSDQWRDEPGPSTSNGYKTVFSRQTFSLSSPPLHSRSVIPQEAGSQKSHAVRNDYDYDYMSDESSQVVESDSDSEPEDLSDKNYIPPKNISMTEVLSSDDEEEKLVRKGQTSSFKRKGRRRDHRTSKTSEMITLHLPGSGRGNRSHGSGDGKKKAISAGDEDTNIELCYRCPFCSHPPSSLLELKSHICHTLDDRHMLMLHRVALPETVRYLCPGDKCSNTYPDGHAYLTHVLPCQGYILDVQEKTVRDCLRHALDRMQRVAGFLNCPVSNCYFVSYFRDQMSEHLKTHLQQAHSSQMLLFRSVCSGMARLYSGLAGFDRYLCYCCQALLDSVQEALQHMQTDHGGKVGGVLHVTQRVSNNSRGIMVVALCLRCSNRIPSLDMWFTHKCPKADLSKSGPGGKAPYSPDPIVPSFEEWLWRTQPSAFKGPSKPKSVDKVESGKKRRDTTVGQLPLIRSILLAEPPRSRAKWNLIKNSKETPRVPQRPAEVKAGDGGDSEGIDDVTTMVQCDSCQEFVAEAEHRHHKCPVVDTIQAAPVSGRGSTSRSLVSVPAGQPPSSLPPSSALQDSSAHISHSKLLSALASLHQNDSSKHGGSGGGSSSAPASTPTASLTPTLAKALSRAHIPGLTAATSLTSASCPSQASKSASVSHPSLISLLTRGQTSTSPSIKAQTPSGEGDSMSLPTVHSDASLPSHSHSDGGMIRSLLMGSRYEPDAGREGSSQRPVTVAEPVKFVETDDSLHVQNPRVTDISATPSARLPRILRRPRKVLSAGPHVSSPSVPHSLAETSLMRSQRAASPSAPLHSGMSVRSSSAPLMSFLRQQGNQVMQVLGNVLDDQDDALSSRSPV